VCVCVCVEREREREREKKMIKDVTSSGFVTAIGMFGIYSYCLYAYVLETVDSAKIDKKGEKISALKWIDGLSMFWPITASFVYLLTVFIGPKVMRTREALNPKAMMLVYNLYQTLFNVYVCYLFVSEMRRNKFKVWGESCRWNDSRAFGVALGVWLHYNNKYLELLDTVWMILRKKDKQVSFLHVYHHVLLVWAWWMVCWTIAQAPCVDMYFGALCNSFIHVVMYSYYGLALLGYTVPWKRYITQLQLLQFAVVFCHAVYVLLYTKCLKILPYSQMFVMANMLVLFGNFYVKSYKNKEKKTSKKNA
jgi:elongation of very long chain fatty acids protein 4